MSDKYPHQSPFMYCSGNPVMRIDPTGMNDGWYVDETGAIIGKDKNNDDRLYFVRGTDAAIVKKDNFENGVEQSELYDPIEIPNYNERQALKKCYDEGAKDNTHEYGMLIEEANGGEDFTWKLYQGELSNPYEKNDHKGRVNFNDPKAIMEYGGTFGADLKYIAHTHNIERIEFPVRPIPPTAAADKVSAGTTGIVFETYFKNVYLYSSNTKLRANSIMPASVFFGNFTIGDKKL